MSYLGNRPTDNNGLKHVLIASQETIRKVKSMSDNRRSRGGRASGNSPHHGSRDAGLTGLEFWFLRRSTLVSRLGGAVSNKYKVLVTLSPELDRQLGRSVRGKRPVMRKRGTVARYDYGARATE